MAVKNNKSKSAFKYVPMIQQAPLDMNFHYYNDDGTLGIKASCKLIKSIDELKEIAKEFEGVTIAVDTETTGLCYSNDFIVGFSISKDAYSGIYVPIRHQIKRVTKKKEARRDEEGNILYTKAGKERQVTVNDATYFECPFNLPDKEALDILFDIMKKAKISLLHNSNYDLNMIRKEGYDITEVKTFDTMILPYIYDPEGRGYMGLKAITKLALGRQVPEFKDVLGKEDNFRYVDPEQGYEYACYDSMNTYGIFKKIYPMITTLLGKFTGSGIVIDGKRYDIVRKDNELIKAFVDYYDHVELDVNKNIAIEYKKQIIKDLEDVSDKIYTYFNRGQFNLSVHSKEFKAAMLDKQIVTGGLTATENISFGKEGIKVFDKNIRDLRILIDKFFNIIKFEGSKLDKRGTDLQFGQIVVSNTKRANYNSAGWRLSKILLTFGLPYFNMKEDTNYLHVLDSKDNKLTKEDFQLILEHMYEKEKEKLEVLKNIQKNSSLNKAMNSYVDKLTQVDKCRMKYKLLATNSSRLASGNGSKSDKKNKNHYYIDLNAQNLTKPHSCFYKAVHSDEEDSILGWKFIEVTDEYAHEHSNDEIIVEGSSVKANIRNCIQAPKGRYVMSRDYSSQEYLALAILSKDSKMIDNFKKGLDPHTSTAYAIWGEKNYTKDKRKKAKTCLGKNSFVLTGSGLYRPYELYNNSLKIADKNGNLQHFAMTEDYGDLVKVQYSTGVCEEYTPNHKVEIWNGSNFEWKEVKDLTENDNVVQLCGIQNVVSEDKYIDVSKYVSTSYSKKETNININTNHFAYVAGLFVSCGKSSVSKSEKGRKGGKNINFSMVADSSRVLKYFNELGINTDKYCSTLKNGSIRLSYAPLMYLLTSTFGSKKLEKRIPDFIFKNWNTTQMNYFLMGLLENYKYNNGKNTTNFKSTNIELVREIALMSSLVGFKTRLTISKNNSFKLIFNDSSKNIKLKDFNKVLNFAKSSPRNNWKIDTEFIDNFRKSNYGILKDKKCLNIFNVMKSSKVKTLSDKLIKKLAKMDIDFPITNNMVCAKVLSKENILGDIYVIQTENHEYVSSCIVSHNCNFLMNYGGGERKLSEDLEIPIEEAREIIRGYEEAFFECVQWKKNEQQKMLKNGGRVFTEFGRPRQFGSWLKMSTNMDVKEGEGLVNSVYRKTISHKIQGLCGDICRNVLLKLYEKYFRHRDPDIDFLSTVHDEVNFTVTKSKLIEYARECEDVMKFDVLRKDLPISTSLDVGYSYGNCFPFIWEDDTRTKLIPKRI